MRPGSRYDNSSNGGENSPDTPGLKPPSPSGQSEPPQQPSSSRRHRVGALDVTAMPPRANSPPPPQMSSTSPIVAPRHQSRSGLPSSSGAVPGVSRISGTSRIDVMCVTDVQQAGLDLRQSMHAAQAQQEGRLGREGSGSPEQHQSPSSPTTTDNGEGAEVGVTYLHPAIPSGVKTLAFSLKTNWGDDHYVGLCGIEVYDGEGRRVVPGMTGGPLRGHHKDGFSVQTTFDLAAGTAATGQTSDPPSALPNFLRESCVVGAAEFSNARTITSGSSQGSRTKKGVTGMKEMFRMPYHRHHTTTTSPPPTNTTTTTTTSTNEENVIWITFRHEISVSLIRIYNYNAGRTHIAKGVRQLQIQDQDNRVLFSGEIARATGNCKNPPENILFASEEDATVLATIVSQNDTEAEKELEAMLEQEGALMRSFNQQNSGQFDPVSPGVRSPHSGPLSCESPTVKKQREKKQPVAAKSVSFAPGALSKVKSGGGPNAAGTTTQRRRSSLSSRSTTNDFPTPAYPEDCPRNVVAAVVTIQSTWGDSHFVGLSGLRFFDGKGQRIFGIRSVSILRPYLDVSAYHTEEDFQAAVGFHREYDNEVAAVIDDDACTACVWRYQANMQVLVLLDEPKLMTESGLGCIQIANYCIQGSTQVGVKRAQVHIIASHTAENASSATVDMCVAALNSTINSADGGSGQQQQHGLLKVISLTSEESPMVLRKSPNQLNALKFQSFDVSLSYDSSSQSMKAAEAATTPTGGFLQRASMTSSMTASVTVRAKTEMKRAMMFLLEPPLPSELPKCVAIAGGCVLPLGYVFKLDVTLLLQVTLPNSSSESTQHATVSRCLKNILKGILLDADTAQENATPENNSGGVGFVNLYDEEGTFIDPELYTTGCSITSLEGINDITTNNNNSPATFSQGDGGVRASLALDRQFRALEGQPSSSSGSTNRAGSSGATAGAGGGVSRRLHQHITNNQAAMATNANENSNTYTTSTTVSLIFVFDIPTALSAIAYRFTGTQRAGTNTQQLGTSTTIAANGDEVETTCTVSSLSVLTDDCIVYQSPDLSDFVSTTTTPSSPSTAQVDLLDVGGDSDPQETPACVAFTYNKQVIHNVVKMTGNASD